MLVSYMPLARIWSDRTVLVGATSSSDAREIAPAQSADRDESRPCHRGSSIGAFGPVKGED